MDFIKSKICHNRFEHSKNKVEDIIFSRGGVFYDLKKGNANFYYLLNALYDVIDAKNTSNYMFNRGENLYIMKIFLSTDSKESFEVDISYSNNLNVARIEVRDKNKFLWMGMFYYT